MIVTSFGSLQALTTPAPVSGINLASSTRSSLDSLSMATYGAIYRTQPNVRTVISFVARNVAQIGLHAFRRESDLDRVRLADHELLRWLQFPNPGVTRYQLFDSLMHDLCIYANAYWLKVRKTDGTIGLARIPPEQMSVEGWLVVSGFVWTLPDGRSLKLAREQVVYFGGYNPHDPIMGLSPLETLRQILIEDAAQTAYRQNYWKNAARIDGVVTRPKDAPRWTDTQRQAFREQWQAKYANAGSVSTVVLEEGMDYKPNAFSARDSEFVPARKLTSEEVTRAYHVPLPMVGILDHATFSNVREQHKHLYQDCLGPWLVMIAESLEQQLLPDAKDTADVYLEFNIAEKMKGSFEEQANALRVLIGRPIMTANEGRARLNLPRVTDDESADQLALPLNTAAEAGAISGQMPTSEDLVDAAAVTPRLLTEGSLSDRLDALTALVGANLDHEVAA